MLITVVTAEQIEVVNSSKPHVEGMNAITQASQGKQLSGIEFTNTRDLLLYKFSIATGTCTCALRLECVGFVNKVNFACLPLNILAIVVSWLRR